MWLKRTQVKTKNGPRYYLQVAKSINDCGRTRHKVIANLGREDKIEREVAVSLVKSLNSGTYDSLEQKEIALLKGKKYGETALLENAFEITGMKRFFTDISNYKGMTSLVVDGIFSLLAYFTFNQSANTSFYQWLKLNYVPNGDKLNDSILAKAIILIKNTEIIRKGLVSVMEKSNMDSTARYNYVSLCTSNNIPIFSQEAVAFITTSENNMPMDFNIYTRGSIKYKSCLNDSNFFISGSGNINLIKDHYTIYGTKHNYIYGITIKDLSFFFSDWNSVKAFVQSEGEFLPYNDIGYMETTWEDKHIVLVRPSPGFSPPISPAHKEPRDIIITNSDATAQTILELFDETFRLQDNFLNLYCPKDLKLMKEKETLLAVLSNLSLLKIVFTNTLEKRFADSGIDVAYAIECVKDIKIVEIRDNTTTRRFHTWLTKEQLDIFSTIDLPIHPTILLRDK
jgi:hypothetical protein